MYNKAVMLYYYNTDTNATTVITNLHYMCRKAIILQDEALYIVQNPRRIDNLLARFACQMQSHCYSKHYFKLSLHDCTGVTTRINA